MRFQTTDGNDYALPDIGHTVNGAIETDKHIENPLFRPLAAAPQIETVTVAPAMPSAPVTPPPADVPSVDQSNAQKEE